MKTLKTFILTILITGMISCNAYKSINTHELAIGMLKHEVMDIINREPVLEYSDITTEVYRVQKRIVRGGVAKRQQYFLYFENDKLVKIDKGERATDYRIKIDTN